MLVLNGRGYDELFETVSSVIISQIENEMLSDVENTCIGEGGHIVSRKYETLKISIVIRIENDFNDLTCFFFFFLDTALYPSQGHSLIKVLDH